MSDIAELLQAVNEVRSGSTFERAKASVTALRTLMNMSAEDKRAVAVLVAERAAPQLVERIESGTGQELSKAQVETVLQMFQKLDGDDLRELQATVLDAERRGTALRDVTRSAAGAAAIATGLEELIAEPDPDGESRSHDIADAAVAAETATSAVGAHDFDDLEDHEAAHHGADKPPDASSDAAQDAAVVAAAKASADAELAQLEAEAESLKAEARRTVAEASAVIAEMATDVEAGEEVDDIDSPTARQPIEADESLHSLFDELPSTSAAPSSVMAADLTRTQRRAGVTAADQETEAALRTVRRALASATSAAAALAIVVANVHDLGDDSDVLLGITGLVPDGWARRRAILVLIERNLLHGDDGVQAVASLAGAGNRRFVAGSLVAGGFTSIAQLRGVVDDRHLERLARRPA